MTLMIQTDPAWDTNHLLAVILSHAKDGERVQFLVEPQSPSHVVQRLRVALSRSRNRNRKEGKKVAEFTLRHETYPWSNMQGKRFASIVMWIEKEKHHETRELLDDLMERDS